MYIKISTDGKITSEDPVFDTWESVISSYDGYCYEWKEFYGYYDKATDAYYWV